ncbi:MAG: class II fumarate hydratase [Candidatus Heimdallarchaeota archaeon]
MSNEFRIERDAMGEIQVPKDALYGAQTQRAFENHRVSGLSFSRVFIRALGIVKAAAVQVNRGFGLIEPNLAEKVYEAALEVAKGKHDHYFILDIFQTGSGTSTNMNANEVIANRANQLLGGQIGTKTPVHPNDHVNMCQSSNDVIPTAMHISALLAIKTNLLVALEDLRQVLEAKTNEFDSVVKVGRTHLQDATPIRLGQEFSAFEAQIRQSIRRITQSIEILRFLPIGGTAVGTGLNAHIDFDFKMCQEISSLTKEEFKPAKSKFESIAAHDAIVEASGALKTLAVSLMKISNDIRWLSSGPRCGIGEISLPETMPGSSIMPGKVNPAQAEAVCQVAAQVIGNDVAITMGGQSGNFELNVMKPLMIHNLLQSIEILANVVKSFSTRCVQGIKVNRARIEEYLRQNLMAVTALSPKIGYDNAAKIAKEAHQSGRTLREVALEKELFSENELDSLLDPRKMTKPGL